MLFICVLKLCLKKNFFRSLIKKREKVCKQENVATCILKEYWKKSPFRERGTCDGEFGALCVRCVHTRIRIHALVSVVLKYAWASLSTFRRKLRRNNTRGLHSILLILSMPPPHYPQVLDTARYVATCQ